MLPNETNVAGFETIKPKFFNPMKAKNKPIPHDIACFILLGRHSTIFCRMGNIETIINRILDQKISPSAVDQGIFSPIISE